ncbi:MAG: cation transporter [Coriobacteriaceae bacterium]|nr:cation transporter [Coriobacteriaceae bacterium]MDD6635906.1 cation transporter [Coriobacteriaceae bacterium]MDD7430510.1 cation transporter [Coriobacteriaceae bacterium]
MLFDIKPEIRIRVEGMHCPKCVARVKDALEAVDGVLKAEVSLEEGSAVVSGNADVQALVSAVESIGFGASV